MRKNISVLSLIVILFCMHIPTNLNATKWIVNVQSFSFTPSSLPNVHLGDTIRWVWINGSHTTTTTAPNIPPGATIWSSPITSAVPSFEYIPAVTGTYNYWCIPHQGMGMVGSFVVSLPPGFAFNLKIFLEGPFDGAAMGTSLSGKGLLPLDQPFGPALPYYGNNSPSWYYTGTEVVDALPADVVDWVLVELRDAPNGASATGATMFARKALFLKPDGSIVDLNGSSTPSVNVSVTQGLFAVIYHRNHVAVMNANPITGSGGVYNFDFTTSSANFYGGTTGCKELAPGVWGMIASDGNADNQVNDFDKIDVWATEAGLSGYLGSDFSVESESNNVDKNTYWLPNLGKSSKVP
jgi:plastocyanin